MNKLIETIDKYVKKVPALPQNIKSLIVQFAPWAAIITVLVSIPSILAIFGAGSYLTAYGLGGGFFSHWTFGYTLMIVFMIANLALRALSIKGLFSRSKGGWMLLFYSILLYFVYSIFSYNIIGGIISTLISLYLAFQVRESYK